MRLDSVERCLDTEREQKHAFQKQILELKQKVQALQASLEHESVRAMGLMKERDETRDMYVAMYTTMSCGHFQRFIASSDEGTNYCVACELEAVSKDTRKLANYIYSGDELITPEISRICQKYL